MIFVLVAIMSGSPAEMGNYNTMAACQSAAKNYTNSFCKQVSGDSRMYGTCWGCMHGCTAEMNKAICGVDPRPQD